MQKFQAWIKIIEAGDVEKGGSSLPAGALDLLNQAAPFAATQLTTYFTAIIQAMARPVFTGAAVGLNPTSGQIGPKDLLVHVTQTSLIRSVAKRRDMTIVGGSGGLVGGATVAFDDGALAEIYSWKILPARLPQAAGVIMANLAIHEFAHDKCTFDKTIASSEDEVHLNGGGGLFDRNVTTGMLQQTNPLNRDNIRFLAGRLGRDVPQFTSWLFNDEAGF